jgi:hypothetical protein
MPFMIGVTVALALGVFAKATGLARDRAFYPVTLIVVAHYYVLFAVMGGTAMTLAAELMVMAVFVIVAVVGFRVTLWIVAAGLAGHGALDAIHGALITNPGVPAWWPAFCLAFDVAAAVVVAWPLTGRGALRKSGVTV